MFIWLSSISSVLMLSKEAVIFTNVDRVVTHIVHKAPEERGKGGYHAKDKFWAYSMSSKVLLAHLSQSFGCIHPK